jgi:hypothetical protein
MPDGRPAIPRPLERRVLVEAGHRCAIPTCRAQPVEFAHIIPWAKVREHSYENLIALCPTCHTRYDAKEIDRESMRQYKQQLQSLSQMQGTQPLEAYTAPIDAFVGLLSAMHEWQRAINGLSIAQLEEESSYYDGDLKSEEAVVSEIQPTLERCTNGWKRTKVAMRRFRFARDNDFFWKADMLYRALKSWADDVVDGLWPSTHSGADDHNDVWECEDRLLDYASENFGVDDEKLWSLVNREWRESSRSLGGTGKRF